MENPAQGVFVSFYSDGVEFKHESEKAGRPIFRDIPHIRKIVPGDTTNIVERVAKDHDIKQYPREWAAFQQTQAQGGVSGTPIEQWPQITRAQVKEAKYFEVHTVEQLAELSDMACQKMGMGYMELRNKAKSYLAAAAGTATLTAQAEENARLQSEIEALREQFKEMSQARGPGRPKKETAEA